MSDRNWFEGKHLNEIFRQTGGRRRYNRQRQILAEERRLAMIEAAPEGVFWPGLYRGLVTRLAHQFGVSVTTAWRDLRIISGYIQRIRYEYDDGSWIEVHKKYRGRVTRVFGPDRKELPDGSERKRIITMAMREFRD